MVNMSNNTIEDLLAIIGGPSTQEAQAGPQIPAGWDPNLDLRINLTDGQVNHFIEWLHGAPRFLLWSGFIAIHCAKEPDAIPDPMLFTACTAQNVGLWITCTVHCKG